MRGWLLDTDVVAALFVPNGAPSVRRWVAGVDEQCLYLSVLTLAELDKGIHNLGEDHPGRARYIASRDALEQRFASRLLSLDDATVRLWGRLSGEAKRATGHALPVIDTLFVANAIRHDLHLVTRNVRDMPLPGVSLFDPWTDDPADFPVMARR